MMELYLACLAVIIIVYISYNVFRKSNLPPGPLSFPILGYLPFLNPRQPYKSLHVLSQKYGPIYGVYLGSIYTVVLSDVALIREALKREQYTGRAPLYLTHGIMGGYGLICAEGILWKDQRRHSIEWLKQLGMSKFGTMRGNLEKRIKVGVAEFFQVIKKLSSNRQHIEGAKHLLVADPMHALHHSMGNILNDLVFGLTYEPADATWKYLQQLQEEGVKHIGVSGIVNFLPILRFLPANRKTIDFLLDGKRRTHAIYDRIIENARGVLRTTTTKESSNAMESESEILVKDHVSGKEADKSNGSHKSDVNDNACILEYFLREKERRMEQNDPTARDIYNDTQLRHVLADLFGAGVDTTLTTLRWFLLYMARNPTLQAQLRLTITEACVANESVDGGGDWTKGTTTSVWIPNLNDLEKLDLLKACVSESQRIRSVVPLGIPHGTTEKTKLCGYEIPKNSMVIPLQWAVHMDAKVWSEPEQFNPNRFLTDEGKFFTPPNFIPFQTGKRICLGEELARMILYLFAGSIIYHYELTLPLEDGNINMDGECGITLTPPNYKLHLKAIHH